MTGIASGVSSRRLLQDPTARKMLLLNLDAALDELLDIRERLSSEKKKYSLIDVMFVSDMPSYRRKIGLKKMHAVAHAVGLFEGASSALRVPVESLLVELWDCRESGQIDQWMDELRASIG
jgi:hypothetical protein